MCEYLVFFEQFFVREAGINGGEEMASYSAESCSDWLRV